MKHNNRRQYLASNTSNLTEGNNNSPNSNNQRWILYILSSGGLTWMDGTTPVTPLAEASITDQPLTYINSVGVVEPLEQIKRNDNIQVGVNLFYNPKEGYFNFEVVPWVEKELGGVTFD